ncbi:MULTISPECIES: hypothetical protein [Actinosynnema]|uniref:hypothetical protein n=1 Tax=Actinosynnema TaxID=40566 RepID=UPI0020A4500D|nr:hypothetical protein [Actinosynnema pretiosum]MCP2097481.1 hypothetical protein [Actinosynnema pretiosum]
MTSLKPDGALETRLCRARQSVEAAQDQLHEALLGDVARIVRDALPTATDLVLEVNDRHHHNQPPLRVGLREVWGPTIAGGQVGTLWGHGRAQSAVQPAYRADEGTAWPAVVAHIEYLLAQAIGAETAGMWWEPEEQDGRTVCWCPLPTSDQVNLLQAEQPRLLAACLHDDTNTRYGGEVWFSRPVARPTMAVTGVAITAVIVDDVITSRSTRRGRTLK